MKAIATAIFAALLAFTLLSCNADTDSQNEPTQQDTSIAVEAATDVIETALESPELAQPTVTETERTLTALTLIPSVEPELLRNVMPNSWHRLERLTEAEEQAFVRENIDALLRVEGISVIPFFSIFREQVGLDIFYRVLNTPENNPDFMSPAISFDQYLLYQNRVLLWHWYGISRPSELLGNVKSFYSVDIIPGGEGAKGVLVTSVEVARADRDNPHNWFGTSPRRNGQLFGSTSSSYYFMDDLLANSFFDGSRSPIRMWSSNALVVPESPLRHGLQSAFDGNPATAFVANSVDNSMQIDISFGYTTRIEKMAITNKPIQSTNMDVSKNRIGTVLAEALIFHEEELRLEQIVLGQWEFNASVSNYQALIVSNTPSNLARLTLNFSGVFFGATYLNYTNISLAELNVMTDNGWLFGCIYER